MKQGPGHIVKARTHVDLIYALRYNIYKQTNKLKVKLYYS